MPRILVMDDDPEVRYGLYEYLKKYYDIFITKKESEIYNILNKTSINLIIFEYAVISIDIKAFINKVKELNNKISVIIISSPLKEDVKKILFECNIDDYVEKPLDMVELEFRIEHLMKRQSSQYRKMIEISNLTINCETNTITYKDNTLEFFYKEFQILYQLFSYPNRIFSKSELVELICSNDQIINENTIRTYINTLRRKTEEITELEIVTVKGIGYKGIIKNSSCM